MPRARVTPLHRACLLPHPRPGRVPARDLPILHPPKNSREPHLRAREQQGIGPDRDGRVRLAQPRATLRTLKLHPHTDPLPGQHHQLGAALPALLPERPDALQRDLAHRILDPLPPIKSVHRAHHDHLHLPTVNGHLALPLLRGDTAE